MIAAAKLKSIVLSPAIMIITPSLDLTGRGKRKDGWYKRGKRKSQKSKKDWVFFVNYAANFSFLILYYNCF